MNLVVALLIGLVVAGVTLAARELIGFRPDPTWMDMNALQERLGDEVRPAPAIGEANLDQMLSYCGWLRREFLSAWRLCRLLAPVSADSAYAVALLRRYVEFHVRLAAVALSTAIGATTWCANCIEHLRLLCAATRASAVVLLQSDLEPRFTPA